MATSEVRDVALLALIYREAYRNRWEDLDSIATDQDVCPGELSWLSMIAADRLTEKDWQIIASLDEARDFTRQAQRVRRSDMLRAEALLHAGPPSGWYPTGSWAEAIRARWGRVRSRMRQFEQEGITTIRDDLDAVAADAWMRATGDTFEQYADAWA